MLILLNWHLNGIISLKNKNVTPKKCNFQCQKWHINCQNWRLGFKKLTPEYFYTIGWCKIICLNCRFKNYDEFVNLSQGVKIFIGLAQVVSSNNIQPTSQIVYLKWSEAEDERLKRRKHYFIKEIKLSQSKFWKTI